MDGSGNFTTTFNTATLGVAGSPYTVTYAFAGNATFSSASDTSTTVTVTKATPTATLVVTNSPQTYTGSGQAATVSISTSSVPGTLSNIVTGGAATETNAGTYAVTASFVPTDTTDYNTLTALSAGNFVIAAAPLTVTATDESMTQGSTVPALAYTYTGLVGNDTSANFTGTLVTTATSSSSPGSTRSRRARWPRPATTRSARSIKAHSPSVRPVACPRAGRFTSSIRRPAERSRCRGARASTFPATFTSIRARPVRSRSAGPRRLRPPGSWSLAASGRVAARPSVLNR